TYTYGLPRSRRIGTRRDRLQDPTGESGFSAREKSTRRRLTAPPLTPPHAVKRRARVPEDSNGRHSATSPPLKGHRVLLASISNLHIAGLYLTFYSYFRSRRQSSMPLKS
ncbi:hypothetical protein DNTS_015437, partial [Danionella cerebrum]